MSQPTSTERDTAMKPSRSGNQVARFRALTKRAKLIRGAAAAAVVVSVVTVAAVTAFQPVGDTAPAPDAAAVSSSPTASVSVSPSSNPTPGSVPSTPPTTPETASSPGCSELE